MRWRQCTLCEFAQHKNKKQTNNMGADQSGVFQQPLAYQYGEPETLHTVLANPDKHQQRDTFHSSQAICCLYDVEVPGLTRRTHQGFVSKQRPKQFMISTHGLMLNHLDHPGPCKPVSNIRSCEIRMPCGMRSAEPSGMSRPVRDVFHGLLGYSKGRSQPNPSLQNHTESLFRDWHRFHEIVPVHPSLFLTV